jgi:hypothetical protein
MMTRVAVLAIAMLVSACPSPPSTAPGPLPTGTTPNAVAVVRCVEGPRLLVAASAEARLDVIDPEGLAPSASVFLGAGASPWDVAVVRHGIDDGDHASRAVVTLAGTHAVALVRPCADPTLMHTWTDDVPFELPTPITLRRADDVDGDGVVEQNAARMLPRSPQAVTVRSAPAGPEVVVAFANILDVSTATDAPMLTGPGLLVRLALSGDDDALALRDRTPLSSCENPGGVAVVDIDHVVVACAGRFVLAAAGHGKASDGAVVLVDVDASPQVVATQSGPHTPGPVVVHSGAVVTGDLLDGGLRRLDQATLAPHDEHAGSGGVDSAFSLIVTDDEVLVAGWFDGRLEHDPFGARHAVAAPDGPPRGLVDLVDDGVRLWGLLTLSAELVPLPREAP